MLLRHINMTLRPLGEGYVVSLAEEYDYPGPWEDDRSIQTNGTSAAQVNCVTDTGDLALRIELHDTPPETDTSRAWQYGPEDVVLCAEDGCLTLAVPCQGDLSEWWPDDEPPLALPPKTAGGSLRVRLYGRADSSEYGIGDRGETHLLQLWPDPEAAAP
ncbi:hypothetical protein ACFVRD_35255 [Streptomyces sp. NPDC057908]|uniref:hypothetical protein n=1 Tax=Streptomyces sp. NPDC057908 TaxID=3346276 RepID=UPI0036E258D6